LVLKNVRDRSQFSRLAQAYPKHSVDLYDSYLHRVYCTRAVAGHKRPPNFRTDIFPDESLFPVIYAAPDYETDTIDLSNRTCS